MKTVSPDIVAAAQAAQRATGVPASVSIGQFALESGWGAHMPPGSFNPFGIKAAKGQPSVLVATHEFVAGRFVVVNAGFRKFASLAEAFAAHAELLAAAPVYAFAMTALPNVSLFVGRMAAHYATDPNYAKDLMGVITADQLTRFDLPPLSAHPGESRGPGQVGAVA